MIESVPRCIIKAEKMAIDSGMVRYEETREQTTAQAIYLLNSGDGFPRNT